MYVKKVFGEYISGSYWFSYWFSIFMYFSLSQLLWLKPIYSKKSSLIIFSTFLLVLPSQRLLLSIVTFNRDSLYSFWMLYPSDILTDLVISILVFVLLILCVVRITKYLNTKKNIYHDEKG